MNHAGSNHAFHIDAELGRETPRTPSKPRPALTQLGSLAAILISIGTLTLFVFRPMFIEAAREKWREDFAGIEKRLDRIEDKLDARK